MATEKITDRWLRSKVELGPEETVVDRGYFWHRGSWWQWAQGRLYLTTERLIWLRNAITMPVGPPLVELAVGDITRCEKRRPPPISWGKALIVETGDGDTHWFSPLPLVEDLSAWTEKVSSAMGGAKPE
jgi:hypothetical protein